MYNIKEAAKIMGVSRQTMSKWVEGGMIRGYEIPGRSKVMLSGYDLVRERCLGGVGSEEERKMVMGELIRGVGDLGRMMGVIED